MTTLRDHRDTLIQVFTKALDSCIVASEDPVLKSAPLTGLKSNLTFSFEGTEGVVLCNPSLDFTKDLAPQMKSYAEEVPAPDDSHR